MGTLNYTVGAYGRGVSQNVLDAGLRTSDAFTTSGVAANVTDGSGAISLRAGELFVCTATVPMWLRFGGNAATVGDGHYLAAEQTYFFEVGPGTQGAVSAIDV